MLPSLGLIDADSKSLLYELKDAFHRIDVLDGRLSGVILVAIVLFSLLGFFGWRAIRDWTRQAQQNLESELREQLDVKMASILQERQAEIERAAEHLRATVATADSAVSELLLKAEMVKSAAAEAFIWESGEDVIQFSGVNYITFVVTFKKEFPEVPQIFVGECADGAWVFVKVDEKSSKKFRWAARSLSGEAITYKTKIQWIAFTTSKAMTAPDPTKIVGPQAAS